MRAKLLITNNYMKLAPSLSAVRSVGPSVHCSRGSSSSMQQSSGCICACLYSKVLAFLFSLDSMRFARLYGTIIVHRYGPPFWTTATEWELFTCRSCIRALIEASCRVRSFEKRYRHYRNRSLRGILGHTKSFEMLAGLTPTAQK